MIHRHKWRPWANIRSYRLTQELKANGVMKCDICDKLKFVPESFPDIKLDYQEYLEYQRKLGTYRHEKR